MDSIKKKIKDQISAINIGLESDVIPDDKEIIKEEILDSFGFVELLTRLEEECCITILDEEVTAENFLTVNRIVQFVERKKKN